MIYMIYNHASSLRGGPNGTPFVGNDVFVVLRVCVHALSHGFQISLDFAFAFHEFRR